MNRGHFIIVGVAASALVLLVIRMSAISEQGKTSGKNQIAKKVSRDLLEPDVCEEAFCVTFAGSLSLGENFLRKSRDASLKGRSYDTYFDNFTKFLKSSDVVIAGLESPLIDDLSKSNRRGSKRDIYWTSANKVGRLFSEQNITAVSLANPHILDFGEEGLERTVELLGQINVDWFGAAKAGPDPAAPYRLEKDIDGSTFKLAVFGVIEEQPSAGPNNGWVFAGLDQKNLAEEIQSLKLEEPGVFVVVYPFWGQDYRWFSQKEREIVQSLTEAGADLVVGYGTHMIGDLERFNDRWLAYGLGDFVFNSPGAYDKYRQALPISAMLRLVIEKENDELKVAHRLYPIFTNNLKDGYRGRFIDAKEFGAFYWALLDKHKLDIYKFRKARLRPGHDIHGRYVQLGMGGR